MRDGSHKLHRLVTAGTQGRYGFHPIRIAHLRVDVFDLDQAQHLTQIKSRIRALCFFAPKQGSNSMPLDTIWFINVMSAFVVLGLTLYLTERRTRTLST